MQQQIIRHLCQDPIIKPLTEKIAFPQHGEPGGVYFDLLSGIISQQLSTKVAQVIENRFLDLFPDRLPHPERLLALEHERLRSVGLSNQKATYMRNIAEFFQRENIVEKDWQGVSDEEIIRYLTQIKGVGKWTVEMILMFTLKRPDVLPLDDYGIQTAFVKLYQLEETGKSLKSRMVEIAENWRPYRSFACYYLWRYKDGKTEN